jgi:diguanylate cyclase (GGDEF)-like protein
MKKRKEAPAAASLLKSIDIFSSLSEEELEALAHKMRRISFPPGKAMFREGESGDELFAVTSGLVSISVRSGDAEDIELSRVGRGAFFGEMAILERAPRSATCKAIETTECLALKAADFEALLAETPNAAVGVLERMLAIAAGRLVKTGSFLSQMVQWGDAARRRAITDAATGLFNRRYLEDSFEGLVSRASSSGSGLSFAMFDLDRFGKLNAAYGAPFCDRLIIRVADAFRSVFGEEDILVRYGGDEFCFLISRPPADALRLCEETCAALRSLSFEEHPELRISCSIGVAHFPEAGVDPASLKDKADKALYLAKESGRDRAVAWSAEVCATEHACEPAAPAEPATTVARETTVDDGPKLDITSIAEKDRIEESIAIELQSRDYFLIIGHRDPDEDCLASMVAFALLAAKFGKTPAIVLGPAVQDNYGYLIKICQYNSITVVREAAELEAFRASAEGKAQLALVLVDTPKPSMIDRRELYTALQADPSVVKIELDHHLETDSAYFGDPGYRLVYEASSTCEIIGRLALRLEKDKELMGRYQIEELVTRNLALAVLSGMVSDSQLGRYLKSARVRRSYILISSVFESILARTTRSGSGNFSSKEELFAALAALSHDEDACFAFMARGAKTAGAVRYAVLDKTASAELFAKYGNETAVSVSKALVDKLAETSGKLGLVGYYDDPAASPFAQFRLRRSQLFDKLDLREALARLGIENGGGHPGAIGMRIERESVTDIEVMARTFADVLSTMVEESEKH